MDGSVCMEAAELNVAGKVFSSPRNPRFGDKAAGFEHDLFIA